METLKYKIIKTAEQYNEYCKKLEDLAFMEDQDEQLGDEIELLTFLIEKWDEEQNSFAEVDPVTLIRSLMAEHNLRAKDLSVILGVSKGLVSDILNYKKGLSKEIIRTLASYFKLSQEAFNRPYKLRSAVNSQLRNASVMNTPKEISAAD